MRIQIIYYMFVLSLVVFVNPVAVFSQDAIETVDDSAFEEKMRPPAVFFHDSHNEKAGIYDCDVCHHLYEDGEKITGDNSIGMECSECHSSHRDCAVDLIRSYHRLCSGCHMQQKSGPVMCGQCHRKQK